MKAFEVTAGSTSIDGLVAVERPEPAVGPGQVRVRMETASLNFRDIAIIRGKYIGGPLTRNTIPLSDGAGVVETVGEGVVGFEPGERVVATFFQGGPMAALGSPLDGVLAELCVFNASGLLKLPDSISFEAAATLPCAGVTAFNALFGGKPLKPGETVLCLGTGGVSIMALQLARAAGARVIVTSSSNDKLARARALGAADTINYREREDWDQAVLELTGGAGADHLLELGGVGTLPRSYQAVAAEGEIKLIGVITLPDGDLAPYPLMFKSASLRGIFVGRRNQFVDLLKAIETNGIQPVIDREFEFDDAAAAYDYMATAAHLGKILIRI